MRGTIAVVSPRSEDRERVVRSVGKVFLVVEAEPSDRLAGSALIVVAEERLEALLAVLGETAPPLVVMGRPAATADPRVTYMARRLMPLDQLRSLLLSLAEGRPLFAPADAGLQSQADARRVQAAFALSRRLAGAADLAATERIAVDALVELTGASRAACLFFDSDSGALWSEERAQGGNDDDRRAVAGIAGFVARTGLPVVSERAADDQRCLAAIDDPGSEPARLLAHPVVGGRGQVQAVLVAVRDPRQPAFVDAEAALVGAFAAMIAPFLDQLAAQVESKALLEAPEAEQLFRQEAIDAQALPRWGEVIRVAPSWVGWAYWALLGLLIASMVYVWVGRVATYSTGPAIVRSTSREEIAARYAGNVQWVVPGGARVAAGDVLVRLDDADARGELDQNQRQFDAQLRNHMLDPADQTADSALRSLRLELDRARLAMEGRLIRARIAGTVTEVLIQPGQRVEVGETVASLAGGSGGLELAVLLPGNDRPQLAPGMPLRLELAGYRFAYQTLTIDSVSTDVLSPSQALQALGAKDSDGVRVPGPVVLVHAHIPGTAFEVDGETFRYHDGMLGQAEVRVREERILYTLIPGLRRF